MTVLIVLSLIAILGVMSMSVAMMNARMRAMSGQQNRKFYENETTLQEIYEGLGTGASTVLGQKYAAVRATMENQKVSSGNSLNTILNSDLKRTFWEAYIPILSGQAAGIAGTGNIIDLKDLSGAFAATLKSYAKSYSAKGDDLEITVQNAYISRDASVGNEISNAAVSTTAFTYNELTLEDVTIKQTKIKQTNKENDVSSAITVDLHVHVPDFRFTNKTADLFEYSVAANKGVTINGNAQFEGSVFGGQAPVEEGTTGNSIALGGNATATFHSPYVIAFDDIALKAGAAMTVDGAGANVTPQIWATDLTLEHHNKLTTNQAETYLLNDLVLSGNRDVVNLGGRYFGFGNAGEGSVTLADVGSDTIKRVPEASSAIIINGMNSNLNLTDLESLVLAGRVHLKVNDLATAGTDSSYYPLGQSIGVIATQYIYLVPPDDLLKGSLDGVPVHVTGNPMPEAEAKNVTYTGGHDSTTYNLLNNSQPYIIKYGNGNAYFFYNFKDDLARRQFLHQYLLNNDNANYFNSLLLYQFGQSSLNSTEAAGIRMNTTLGSANTISSAGDLYTVNDGRSYTSDEGDHNIFDLVVMDNPGISAGKFADITYVQMCKYLQNDYKNLLKGLSKDENDLLENAKDGTRPLGNYINFAQIPNVVREAEYQKKEKAKSKGTSSNSNDNDAIGHVALYNGDVTVTVSGETVTIVGGSQTDTITDGEHILIVSNKDVTVNGSGTFRGSIFANGKITVNAPNAAEGGERLIFANSAKDITRFDADSLLALTQVQPDDPDLSKIQDENKDLPGTYFYEYAGTSGVKAINNYTDFVTIDNYRKADLTPDE